MVKVASVKVIVKVVFGGVNGGVRVIRSFLLVIFSCVFLLFSRFSQLEAIVTVFSSSLSFLKQKERQLDCDIIFFIFWTQT